MVISKKGGAGGNRRRPLRFVPPSAAENQDYLVYDCVRVTRPPEMVPLEGS